MHTADKNTKLQVRCMERGICVMGHGDPSKAGPSKPGPSKSGPSETGPSELQVTPVICVKTAERIIT